MARRDAACLAGAFAVALLAGPLAGVAAASAPNVVIVLAEDLPADGGGPALAALAARGRRFSRAYAQYPEPAPSRASLLTGMRPETTQVWEASPRERPRDSTPLQEHFAKSGWWTARVGPVYGGEAEVKLRWDRAIETAPGGPPPGQRAAALIAERHAGRPFFLVLGLARDAAPADLPGPDGPVTAPEAPRAVELPTLAFGDTGFFGRPDRRLHPVPTLGEGERRARERRSRAWSRWVDTQLAALIDGLAAAGVRDRTLVVFAGDSAPDLGRHGALREDLLVETRLHVPLVIAGPGVGAPGRPATGLVELLDVYPTLVELAGAPRVRDLEGTSLVPLLRDPGARVKRAVFSAVERLAGQLGRSLRTRRWRYDEWPDGSEELYDHRSDPGEFVNLARSDDTADLRRSLRGLLDERDRGSRLAVERKEPRLEVRGRRNVLLLAFDDLATELGTYGRPVSTPGIDALARRGRRFDRAYAQAPECTPSRLSFLTGWLPERVVVWDYNDHTTQPVRRQLGWLPLQEYFRSYGYFTAKVGKIDDGLFPERFGWDLAERWTELPPELAGLTPGPVSDVDWWSRSRYLGPGRPGRPGWWIATGNPDALEPDALRVRRAVELMEEPRDRPFFIALGLTTPHLRWVAPEHWFRRYDPDRVSLRPTPEGDLDDVPAIALKREPQDRPGAPLAGPPAPLYGPPRSHRGLIDDPALRRQATAAYRAAVSFVDAQVAELMSEMDRLDLWGSTVVVLFSDHGFHLGGHGGLWRKDTVFEEVLRVPLVIAAPEVGFPGVATGELAELTDLYPTLVELAGLPEPPGLDGVSLVPVLRNPEQAVRRAAVSVREARAPELGISVRDARWRYTEWPDGSRELYDLEADPAGLDNLAADPAHSGDVAAMVRLLDRGYRASLAGPVVSGGGR